MAILSLFRYRNQGLDRLIRILFFGGLVLIPLFWWPYATVEFEVPKVWLVLRWVDVLAVLTLIKVWRGGGLRKLNWRVLALLLGFVVWSLMVSVLGVDLKKSLVGNHYRVDGLLTLVHLMGLSLVIGLNWRKSCSRRLVYSLAWSGIVVSVIGVAWGVGELIEHGLYSGPWSGAVGAMFGNPNFLAGYLVVTLPSVYLRLQRFQSSWVKLLVVGVVLAAILMTRSLGGMMGVGVFTMLLLMQKTKALVLMVLMVVIALGVLMVQEEIRSDSTGAPDSRVRIVNKLIRGWQLRPWVGYGVANVDLAFEMVDWPIYYQDDVYVDKAHSVLLEVLVTSGVVGLGLYIVMIGGVGFEIRRLKSNKFRWVMMSTFVLYLVHSQTNVISISEEMVFWVLVGVSLGRTGRTQLVKG